MMKLSTLIFMLLVTIPQVAAQWLTMDQFNTWEKIITDDYALSPDSITRQPGALTRAQMLKQNQEMIKGFESAIPQGLALLRYPRPVGLKYLETNEKSTDREKADVAAHNTKVTQDKEKYLDARIRAATLLATYHYNYPRLVEHNQFLVREIRRTIFLDNIRSNLNDQVRVLSVLKIPKALQDSLLLLPGLTPEVRARLGDAAAEQTAIDAFKKAVADTVLNTPVITEKARALFFIDSRNTQTAFVEALNSKVEKFKTPSTTENIQVYTVYPAAEILLVAYEDYYPHDLLYFQEYVYKHPKLYQADARAGFSAFNNRSSFYYRVVSEYFTKKFSQPVSIPFGYRMREIYRRTKK